jgi:hypothetical protein
MKWITKVGERVTYSFNPKKPTLVSKRTSLDSFDRQHYLLCNRGMLEELNLSDRNYAYLFNI